MNNKSFIRGALLGALTVLLVISTASCGRTAVGRIMGSFLGGGTDYKLELIDGMIDEYYLGIVDKEALKDGIYKGYIEALGDPYSEYYNAQETTELQEGLSGEYSGVGAVMMQNYETGYITVTQVYEGSPAEEAGLRAEDILYRVDDKEVLGYDLSEVVTWVKGEEGTTVEITVLRGTNADEVTMTATRRKIQVQTVSCEMKDHNIGYIEITEFDAITDEQYLEALEVLEAQGMEGLVVDLRNNPGGSLDTVVNVLDRMLPEGIIVTVQPKTGKAQVHQSDEENQFTKPLVVLMNEYSASASEIYAGAIQDYEAGMIVGTQSYGKGVVQQWFDLRDGSSMKLTMAEYLTPDGRSIHGEGITPDIELEYEYDEERPEWDNQLEKALEIIRNQL